MSAQSPQKHVLLLIILFLAIVPYFARLGSSSLWDSNEAFYSETPREMIETGDLINPSFNYRPRFNKPPLSYWIVLASYKIFGVSESSERIPMALAAVAMMLTAFALARRVFSYEAGLMAAIALAASPRFLMFSRRIFIDVYLAMFLSLALLFFLIAAAAERNSLPKKRRIFFLLMYVSVGLGVLTKGPVALLLPALTLAAILAFERSLTLLRKMMLPGGAGIIALIVLPWYLALYWEHGIGYIASFLLDDNISRYAQTAWGPSRGFFFYIRVLLGDLFPWSLFLAAAILSPILIRARALRKPDEADHGAEPEKFGRLTLLAWIGVIVLFFSLSKSKEDLYILPVYPACAALIGGVISGKTGSWFKSRIGLVTPAACLAGLIMALIGAALIYALSKSAADYRIAGATAAAMVALAGGAIVLAAASLGRSFFSIAAMAGSMTAINWLIALRGLPDFERFKAVRPFCEIIKRNAPTDAKVGYYRFPSPSMVFYLRRPIFELGDDDHDRRELNSLFLSGHPVFCLMTDETYEETRRTLRVQTYVLASRPAFQVKLKTVLDGVEPPRILLISNMNGIELN